MVGGTAGLWGAVVVGERQAVVRARENKKKEEENAGNGKLDPKIAR